MTSPILLIQYDLLEQIAIKFGHETELTATMLQAIQQAFQPLANGDWQGEGFRAFDREMRDVILPAAQRLAEALGSAQHTTAQCRALLRVAEEEAAALFTGQAASGSVSVNSAASFMTASEETGSDDLIQRAIDVIARAMQSIFGGGPPGSASSDLKSQLIGPPPMAYEQSLDAIHSASLTERQAMLHDPALLAQLKSIYGPNSSVVVAALLEDALFWPAASRPNRDGGIAVDVINPISGTPYENDFAKWMRGEASPPDSQTGKMNCWEAAMYSAYLSGQISESDLRSIHTQAQQAALATGDYYGPLGVGMGADRSIPITRHQAPPAGSLIFFDDGSGSAGGKLSHVAIATGRLTADGDIEVMSHWVLPKNDDDSYHRTMQRTTIEALQDAMNKNRSGSSPAGSVSYTPDPWRRP